jgi:hypothetical protein
MTVDKTDRDKRRAPRVSHNSVVEIYDESGREIAATGRLVDFSKVGVCFSSTSQFTVNTELRLRLRILREGRLYVRGRIVWAKKQANRILYGLEFQKVHEVV